MAPAPFIGWMKEVTTDWNRVDAVKQLWGKLTDDDLTQIDGSPEKLEGKSGAIPNRQG
jgi:uncharacterized protein YjbJ (UPF0337 family)